MLPRTRERQPAFAQMRPELKRDKEERVSLDIIIT
jgi:hypothetical protein